MKGWFGKPTVQATITLGSFVLFAALMILMTFHEVPEGSKEQFAGGMGFLTGTMMAGAVGFYFNTRKTTDDTDIK